MTKAGVHEGVTHTTKVAKAVTFKNTRPCTPDQPRPLRHFPTQTEGLTVPEHSAKTDQERCLSRMRGGVTVTAPPLTQFHFLGSEILHGKLQI